ncbi:hypothetical protein FRB94_012096 [Tulasnella sp. JGI-2019a]|nr:hypothetical protein FRB94_012096 [Tulasnella sp. JGI-2019a]
MDETLTTLSGRGSPTDVSPWYPDGPPIIRTAVIFPGTEELCLVERSGRARIYSFLTQKFRHACIFLPAFDHVQAAPDASALLAISAAPIRKIGVYHRASFGAAKNDHQFILALPDVFSAGTSFTITSLGHRNISVLALVPSQQSICSVSLQISRQKTEYQFLTHTDRAASEGLAITESNCLIDCFAEVWRRYPVVPAMKRETISPNGKVGAAVTFVVEDAQKPFLQYFKFMIREFERVSRKPTDGRLDAIQIHTTAFRDLDWNGSEINSYKAGEWLVELVCLIPIHIAIAKENRFMPLKNGVLDQQFEQQLLGANVSRIIDSLSIGWYESILSSYMVTKPVRVISSMGEQSVGKSYSLNHITDSTFATSGVRTTEGVWLSVCPTRDTLVVALDFEGVQSIERTPQEDVLLILFNTALSNMVIFRNNFALSRDVANMFTSFQASARIFAPASNPGLFKGRLVVAIKDVVDRDSDEIVQEFKMKFSQIVGKEQANNFITNLHAGQLTVIPWNVIESREFYTLFSKLSKQLFKQKTTHASAGEFLMTLKTLMAKLKAQDWGAMDQTLVKHRCALPSARLHTALARGYAEVDPVTEELKNLDSQEIIPSSDSQAIFYLGKSPEERQDGLRQLLVSWHPDPARKDIGELKQHLQTIVKSRVTHVDSWIASNISRFQTDNADIRALKREFEKLSESLNANAQPCFMGCSLCRLPCLLIKSHESQNHDCNTLHRCPEICEFPDDHDRLSKKDETCVSLQYKGRCSGLLNPTHCC